jgi:hypothetical protein
MNSHGHGMSLPLAIQSYHCALKCYLIPKTVVKELSKQYAKHLSQHHQNRKMTTWNVVKMADGVALVKSTWISSSD